MKQLNENLATGLDIHSITLFSHATAVYLLGITSPNLIC